MVNIFRHRQGFTLSELLVSAMILAVLAAVAVPLAKIALKREREIEFRQSLRLIREAIDQYKKLADEKKIDIEEDSDGYPPSLEILVKGVQLKDEDKSSVGKGSESKGSKSKGGAKIVKFLRRIPKDPLTDSFDWQLRSSQDAFDSTSWGGQNVFDVYTKSNKTAIDGTKYKDW
jgi:general secretion pathway protein G